MPEAPRSLNQSLGPGRLEPHFQAVVDCGTGTLRAVEALARWRTDDDLIEGEDLLELAAQFNACELLDAEMLRLAVDQIAAWRRMPGLRSLELHANLSPQSLRDPQLAERIEQTCRSGGFDPAALWMEVTESSVIDDLPQAAATLTALRSLGVRIWVDDFGAGYASLSYVKQLPIDGVKIDRSFITDIESSETGRAIVAAVVSLASPLALGVIAEGIESESQADLVRTLGVHATQGFYYGRPQAPWDGIGGLEGSPRSANGSAAHANGATADANGSSSHANHGNGSPAHGNGSPAHTTGAAAQANGAAAHAARAAGANGSPARGNGSAAHGNGSSADGNASGANGAQHGSPRPSTAAALAKAREKARLRVVAACRPPSGERDPVLDEVARFVADVCEVEVAVIGVEDRDRTHCLAQHGCADDGERDCSAIARLMPAIEVAVVPDMAEDPRFATEPLVRDGGMRFLAGETLSVDGRRVGSLVLLGARPRRPTKRQLRFLHQAAERAQAHLQLRYVRSRLREAEVALALARS